jgi:hypothetical protein
VFSGTVQRLRGRKKTPDAAALLGTWKMVAWTRRVIATGETSDAMGPNPVGTSPTMLTVA